MAYITPHIISLVINALGGRHTDTHTYRCMNQSNFKNQARTAFGRTPGLKMQIVFDSRVI